ncbi:barstar family protein [Chryseobacterium sp. PBS4-4]|uniref:Barstar family protein n=1 Tax=Chryseobacterium edaphi TaxID=2976532 RepID=A0ABT2W8V0_9FLAO|nr:barstar family protein [Chryseobacterium edaphi]MCU7618633.1 barstar family protein [Chryseobacterium edaphi]
MFGFSLDSGHHPPELITIIEDVKNLESNNKSIGYRELRLLNVENIARLKATIDEATINYDNNGFIHYLNENQEVITYTFISKLKVIKSKKNNITLSGSVWHQPKGFLKAFKLFGNNEITTKNKWREFKKDELQGWLVFALCSNKLTEEKEIIEIIIDGNDFNNLDEFFCVIGEEINGITGYFGRDIGSFNDCLRGDFGVKSISKITWMNHLRSKKILRKKFNDLVEIFKEYKINLIFN